MYIFFNLKKLNKNNKIKTSFNDKSSERNWVKIFSKLKDKIKDINERFRYFLKLLNKFIFIFI